MDAQIPQLQSLSLASGEEILYELNREAFAKDGIDLALQRHLGEITRFEDTLFIIIGSDSGLIPLWLNQEGLAQGSRVICIEPDWVIDQLPHHAQAFLDNEQIRIAPASNWQALHETFQFAEYSVLERIQVLHSLAGSDDYLGVYHAIQSDVQSLVTELHWRTTKQLGGEMFMRRQLENLADFAIPAENLRGQGKGRQAIVLAGGPSLDEVIGEIRANRDHFTLIAVSRISRKLQLERITPDIVVSIDPHEVSFEVSREMLLFDPPPLFVCAHHCNSSLVGQWTGSLAYLGIRLPWDDPLNVTNIVHTGPTVGNTAIGLAIAMGFERIALAGLDLCYSPSGNSHASGSIEHEAGPYLSQQDRKVATYSGQQAFTEEPFALAVESVGQQAEIAMKAGCKVVSLSWHGAQIPNVYYQPVDDLIAESTNFSSTPPTLDLKPTLEERARYLKKARTALQSARKDIYQIVQLTKEALDCNAHLHGRKGKEADFKYKHRMDKIERRLDKRIKRFSKLVRIFSARAFLKLVRPGEDRDQWSDEELENWGRAYYQTYHTSAQALLSIIDDSEQRVKNRLDEIADKPLEQLAKTWLKTAASGRYKIWSKTHPGQNDNALIAKLSDAFEAQLKKQDLMVKKRAKQQRHLNGVRKKIQRLVADKAMAELETLQTNLGLRDDKHAQILHALIAAHLEELTNNTDAAQPYYQLIIDTVADQPGLTESSRDISDILQDALKGMVKHALNHHDVQSALLGLGVLSDLSPVFLPQYADLLYLNGDTLAAVDAYSHYITQAPKDLGAFMRLGKIFHAIGAEESAIMAFDHILSEQPNNTLALDMREQAQQAMQTGATPS